MVSIAGLFWWCINGKPAVLMLAPWDFYSMKIVNRQSSRWCLIRKCFTAVEGRYTPSTTMASLPEC